MFEWLKKILGLSSQSPAPDNQSQPESKAEPTQSDSVPASETEDKTTAPEASPAAPEAEEKKDNLSA